MTCHAFLRNYELINSDEMFLYISTVKVHLLISKVNKYEIIPNTDSCVAEQVKLVNKPTY